MINIAFYGSHNGSYVVEKDGEILLVLEIERFLGQKNMGIAQYKVPNQYHILFLAKYIPQFIMKYLGITEFDTCYYQNTEVFMDGQAYELQKYIPAKSYVYKLHHKSHAAGCFYQSPFEKALIFSFDGGGNDGMFNVYVGDRKEGIKLVDTILNPIFNSSHIPYNLGFPYMVFAQYLNDITFESLGEGNLVYPGKLMGLASYGSVDIEWLPYFIQFYKNNPDGNIYEPLIKLLESHINRINSIRGQEMITFDVQNRLSGQVAYDIAATSQRAFEECFFEVAEKYITQYSDLPLCLTGGCALNITLNTATVNKFNKKVFVGPNPNDCGISVGMVLDELKPESPVDLTYAGLPLLDIDMLPHYLSSQEKLLFVKYYEDDDIVNDLMNGNIIGIARGRAEHGPRALGNRSILCNPSIDNMKDVLNEKVKNREWYRPFAPVVRLEDVSTYFEWEEESRWMSFCPKVKSEWKEKLSAITHIDGTARVQTVTREQNEWLYDLLTKFKEKSGIGVLLNTSFNVNKKPILSSVQEAINVFKNTNMDGIVIENVYITKTFN